MKNSSGFTLIEMMIVVVIMGILATIAIPSYNQYTRNAAIADARASLLALSSAMEQHRAQNGTYLRAAEDSDSNGVNDNTGAPAIYVNQSPETGTPNFNLTISAATAGTYTLTATATGAAGITLNDTITMNSLGVKAGTGSLAEAWGSDESTGGSGGGEGSSSGSDGQEPS